mmetsp:Transcript_248/g.471  ORF Transcript_248/g.471 Transcript_248/m.471 type:complete len:205 (+) Transcript_248:182-796(+)
MPKNNMFAIKVRSWLGGDEELRSIGVWSRIRHGQEIRFLVFQLEVFVIKLFAINGLSSGSVPVGKITPLDHELFNDTVERTSLEMEWFPLGSYTLFTRTQGQKVCCCLGGNILVELHHNFPQDIIAVFHFEKDVRIITVGVGNEWSFLIIVQILLEERSKGSLFFSLGLSHGFFELRQGPANVLIAIFDIVGSYQIIFGFLQQT